MKIIKMLSKNTNRFWGMNPKNYITIQETGNTNKGANALNHARYINSGSSATWHYTVDDKQIIQHFDDSVQCWHAGDGKGTGNLQSIGIELCVNSDGDFNKTVKNAVELVKYLMKKYNISIDRVVQHNRWSGKNCPQNLRSGAKGITWDMFISMISEGETSSKTDNNDKVDIDDLARRTIRGEFGNGEERKRN